MGQLTSEKQRLQVKLDQLERRHEQSLLSVLRLKKEKLLKDEEKLQVSRAVVTMEKSLTKMKRERQNGNFADTSKLVGLEQEVVNLTLETKNAKFVQEKAKLEAEEHKQTALELEEQLANTRKQLGSLKLEKSRGEGSAEQLSSELVAVMNQKTELEKEKTQLAVRMVDLKGKYDKAEVMAVSAEDQLDTFRERVAQLKLQNEKLAEVNQVKHIEAEDLQKQLTDARKRLSLLEDENAATGIFREMGRRSSSVLSKSETRRVLRDWDWEELLLPIVLFVPIPQTRTRRTANRPYYPYRPIHDRNFIHVETPLANSTSGPPSVPPLRTWGGSGIPPLSRALEEERPLKCHLPFLLQSPGRGEGFHGGAPRTFPPP